VCWTPSNLRNYDDFASRLVEQVKRFSILGINYSNSFANVEITTEFNPESKKYEISLKTDFPGALIRYTTDGSEPQKSSLKYSAPFPVDRTTIIKAAAFRDGSVISKTSEKKIWLHLASGKTVTYSLPFSDKYSGGGDNALVNSIRGTNNHSEGTWQGFEGSDLKIEIDLGSLKKISKLSVGTLQNVGSWIFFPVEVRFYYAGDDRVFSKLGTVVNHVSTNDPERRVQDLSLEINPVDARYVRVEARNLGICPPGHGGAGNKCWMFIDEIIVE
jgi:hexosaminidase